MIIINKHVVKLVTELAEQAVYVKGLTDEQVINNNNAIKDLRTNLSKELGKVTKTLGQLFVVNNAERMRRGLKETLDSQQDIFDYIEEQPKLESK